VAVGALAVPPVMALLRIADLLFLSEVPHPRLAAGGVPCVHPHPLFGGVDGPCGYQMN
jgi:hypothetical protein